MASSSRVAAPGEAVKIADTAFFRSMAIFMVAIIVAGFAVNLVMGRSTFAVPPVYHIHAAIFFGWVALYVAQSVTIARGHVGLHRKLGLLAYALVPMMILMGLVIMITSLRRTGSPFFFDQNEFLFSNRLLLVLFGAKVITALRTRRYTGWHERLMLTAMSILTGPGVGRLLPMPLMIPHAWRITMAVTLIFPVAGMIADKRRNGHVHPAYWWGVGAIILTQIVADIIAYSDWGIAITEAVVNGTPGGARPMAAFLPPGF